MTLPEPTRLSDATVRQICEGVDDGDWTEDEALRLAALLKGGMLPKRKTKRKNKQKAFASRYYLKGMRAAEGGLPRVKPELGWCNPESSDMTKTMPYPNVWHQGEWLRGYDAVIKEK